MASITSTKAVDLKVNKINKANYDSMRTAGTITDTMAADEMWIGDGRLVSDSDLSAHTGDSGIHMTTAEKSKLSGIATGANNYIHPTTDGNKHVPATGTANDGKVLKAGATAGSLSWGTLTATDVGAYTKTEIDNKEFVYSDPAATFENFDPINAQYLGGNAPGYYASQAGVDSAIGQIQDDLAMDNTIPHTQTESIKSLPVGALQGKVSGLKMEGLSLVNSMVNGDFSNGTGWGNQYGTLSDSNKIATSTANGVTSAGNIVQNSIVSNIGDKIFLYGRCRVTNELCTKIVSRIYDGADVVGATIANPVQNQWYDVATTMTRVSAGSSCTIYFYHHYTDAATANGKVMEVDGNAGVFAINMTALGIESFTEEQMLDLVRSGYFEGLKGVEKAKAKTVGKNLFDKNTVQLNKELNASGEFINSVNYSVSDYIPIKANTTYTKSNNIVYLYYYDGQKKFISPRGANNQQLSPANARYMKAELLNPALDTAQIEEGSVATPYEPYQSSELAIEPTLRSLPNGIKDRIFEQDGQIWFEKNVEEYVLKSGDIIGLITTELNVDYLYVSMPDSIISPTVAIQSKSISTDKTIPSTNAFDKSLPWNHGYGTNYWGNKRMLIFVPKGTYATLSVAQTALAGTKIHYQLATPQLINLTEQGMTEGQLESFENGTCYLDADTFHSPSVEFSVPANLGAQIGSLIESSNYQAKQIEGKANKVQEDWIRVTLQNGWQGNMWYRKNEFGDVELSGNPFGGTVSAGTTIFTLPVGYRINRYFGILGVSGGTVGMISIETKLTGEVTIRTTTTFHQAFFDNVVLSI